MPISTGTQLIFTTLFSVIIFNEWTSSNQILTGSSAIILIMFGIFFCGMQKKATDTKGVDFKIVLTLILSSICLTAYVVINKFFNIYGLSIILPQATGILCSSILIRLISKEKFSNSNIRFNLLVGISWFLGNIGIFIATTALGVSKSFSISQTNVIVATIFGIIIFKEKKTQKEWLFIMLGIVLIMVGVFILGSLK